MQIFCFALLVIISQDTQDRKINAFLTWRFDRSACCVALPQSGHLVELFLHLVDSFFDFLLFEEDDLPELDDEALGEVVKDRGHLFEEGLG